MERAITRKNTAQVLQSSGLSVAERLSTFGLPYEIEKLIQLERSIPVSIGLDETARLKITDSCGMACVFCHNEGTPVAAAYHGDISSPNFSYMGGRVSVFEHSNGVNFIPGTMLPDQEFDNALDTLASSLGTRELHLTGGEPTLHQSLPELIRMARSHGFSVKLTSNGENYQIFKECAVAGLEKVNFSIFGATAEELAEVQCARYHNVRFATQKIKALRTSINEALNNGIKVDANIVMPDYSHADRIKRIINEYDQRISIKILNDLDKEDESYISIYRMMAELGAEPIELRVEAGSSNSRTVYRLPNGRMIFFKQIRRTTLPETCKTCSLNNNQDCKEGYYGIRTYIDSSGNYKIGVCIQRMDLTMDINDFANSNVPDEINQLRLDEWQQLNEHYAERIKT